MTAATRARPAVAGSAGAAMSRATIFGASFSPRAKPTAPALR
jgi:hypothetical protein